MSTFSTTGPGPTTGSSVPVRSVKSRWEEWDKGKEE